MLMWALVALVLLALAGWALSWCFDARIAAALAKVRESPAATTTHEHLPPLLEAYVARTNLTPGMGMRWFRIQQQGEMRMKPDEEWKPFTAVQVFAVSEPSFVWRARFKAFKVVDSLVAGHGRLEARVFGVIPVADVSGASATRAQLLRYLAEIAWVPRAVSDNRSLSWQQLGDTDALGVLEYEGERVELRFVFDEHGDIRRVEGERERSVGNEQVLTPWLGLFSDYGTVGGVRIPRHGEVRWMLDSGPFTYWRGTITALEAN